MPPHFGSPLTQSKAGRTIKERDAALEEYLTQLLALTSDLKK
jgi:hypothetical protein